MYVRVYTHNPFTRCIVCMRGISRLMPKFTTFSSQSHWAHGIMMGAALDAEFTVHA